MLSILRQSTETQHEPRCPICGLVTTSVAEHVSADGIHTRNHLDNAGHIWQERWAVTD